MLDIKLIITVWKIVCTTKVLKESKSIKISSIDLVQA